MQVGNVPLIRRQLFFFFTDLRGMRIHGRLVAIMININELKPAICELCRHLRVKRLDIFGSAIADDFTAESDVDVLVQFDRGAAGGLFNRYFDLKEGLEEIFGRVVDVIVEESLKNPYFKLSIERTRKNIYAA
jgi:predicted nucleotidyltransferase